MKDQFRNVLAPTDLSDASLTALRYARFFADRMGARLTVLYADPVIYPVDVMGDSPSLSVATTPEHVARLNAEVEAFASASLQGRPYSIVVEVGQPVPMILKVAEQRDADLLVMGTHALRGWRRAILGSVTEGVLHGSRCPVLTVSSLLRTPVMRGEVGITRIVCPVNFTEVAQEALARAASLAELLSAEIVIVHVVEPGEVESIAADEARVREWISPELRAIGTFRELVLRGGAAERVLDCIDDLGADLLVIGAQHKLFRDTTVIGTTTERLVRFARCPVLTVTRAPAAPQRKPESTRLAHV